MHPALSVVFLTTLIGMAQGLFLALFTTQIYSLFGLLPEQNVMFYVLGTVVALLLLGLGLFASFFHLGRPERAWRAATMWRTSWLSREVIVLPLVMLFVFLYGLAHFIDWTKPLFALGKIQIDLTVILGTLATFFVFALFVCTGMIYATIRFIPEWRSPLTVINFMLMGLGSGFLAASAFSVLMGKDVTIFHLTLAIGFTFLGFIFRAFSLWRNANVETPGTIQSAIGVKHPNIKQKSQGSMGGSFNTREFNHGKTETFLWRVKWGFIVLAFIVPLILMLVVINFNASSLGLMLMLALVSMYAGLLAERWYFFAEASHPQNIYYQAKG